MLLNILWELGTYEVPNAEYEVLTSKEWDWQYLIDFDSNEFIVSYDHTGCVSEWILEEIPGRYEIFGSLQSEYDTENRFLRIMGQEKDEITKQMDLVDWAEKFSCAKVR